MVEQESLYRDPICPACGKPYAHIRSYGAKNAIVVHKVSDQKPPTWRNVRTCLIAVSQIPKLERVVTAR